MRVRNEPSPGVHGHAGFRGADAGRTARPGPRHPLRLFPAAASERPGHGALARPRPHLRCRAWVGGSHATVAERRGGAGGLCGAGPRCRHRGGLWPAPATGDPRCAAPGLLQPARLAAAALARRRPGSAGGDGGRRRNRRDGDEDGSGAGYRPGADGRTGGGGPQDGGRTDRAIVAAGRRSDGAGAGRDGARRCRGASPG